MNIRTYNGSISVEVALTAGVYLFVVFSFIELSRALYVMNSMQVAAQTVATEISINEKRGLGYAISNFTTYADQVRYPGSIVNSEQFTYDVVNATNNSTVISGVADPATSTKVVVTTTFPPPNSSLRIPVFDPGSIIGYPVFGMNGLQIRTMATCFLERSRRPIISN